MINYLLFTNKTPKTKKNTEYFRKAIKFLCCFMSSLYFLFQIVVKLETFEKKEKPGKNVEMTCL